MRLKVLDSFRGLAALSVVLFHYTFRYYEVYGYDKNVNYQWIDGHYGVHFFFMISGFVIFLTLTRTKSPLDFVVSRFSRLFPIYWVAILITFSAVSIFGLPGYERSYSDVFVNFTMTQGILTDLIASVNIPHVDGVYWSLQYELIFYLLIFIVFLTGQLKNINWVCFGWLILSSIHLILEQFGHGLFWKLQVLFILKYAHFFIAGIMFYQIINKQDTLFTHLLILFSFVVSLLYPYSVDIKTDLPVYDIQRLYIIPVIYVLFYLFVYKKLEFLASPKVLLYFGAISYSLYLIHQHVGFIIMRSMYAAGSPGYLNITVAIAISILLATIMTYFIERPALKGIRNIYNRYKTKKSS